MFYRLRADTAAAPTLPHWHAFLVFALAHCVFATVGIKNQRWNWLYRIYFICENIVGSATKHGRGLHCCYTSSRLQVWSLVPALSEWIFYLLCLCGFCPGNSGFLPQYEKHANDSNLILAVGASGNGKLMKNCPSMWPWRVLPYYPAVPQLRWVGCINAHHPECRGSGYRNWIDNIIRQNISESLGWNCLFSSGLW